MRIDYCPKCGKAGLKYASNWNDPDFYSFYFVAGKPVDKIKKIYPPEGYGTAKWCPRCKEWVKPENHPYIGSSVSSTR